jgi:hypothetical protein
MKSLVQRIEKQKPRQKLDERTLRKIEEAEEGGIIIGSTLDLLLSLRAQYESRGFFTEGQRQLVRKIEKDYETYPLQKEACQRLVDLYDKGKINPVSYGFIESVVAGFNEFHRFTDLQWEQIVRILVENDEDAPTEEGKP